MMKVLLDRPRQARKNAPMVKASTTDRSMPKTLFSPRRRRLQRVRAMRSYRAESPPFLWLQVQEELTGRLTLLKPAVLARLQQRLWCGVMPPPRDWRSRPATAEVLPCRWMAEAWPAHTQLDDRPDILADSSLSPLAPGQFDLLVNALDWQHYDDLPGLLVQWRQALRPDGLLLGALLGEESLRDLRHSFFRMGTQAGRVVNRLVPMVPMDTLSHLLQRTGFALPVIDRVSLTVHYDTLIDLFHDLRMMAESNHLAGHYPLTRSELASLDSDYRAFLGLDAAASLPVRLDLLYVTAWAPAETQPKPLRRGSAKISLATALDTKEHGTGDLVPE